MDICKHSYKVAKLSHTFLLLEHRARGEVDSDVTLSPCKALLAAQSRFHHSLGGFLGNRPSVKGSSAISVRAPLIPRILDIRMHPVL